MHVFESTSCKWAESEEETADYEAPPAFNTSNLPLVDFNDCISSANEVSHGDLGVNATSVADLESNLETIESIDGDEEDDDDAIEGILRRLERESLGMIFSLNGQEAERRTKQLL